MNSCLVGLFWPSSPNHSCCFNGLSGAPGATPGALDGTTHSHDRRNIAMTASREPSHRAGSRSPHRGAATADLCAGPPEGTQSRPRGAAEGPASRSEPGLVLDAKDWLANNVCCWQSILRSCPVPGKLRYWHLFLPHGTGRHLKRTNRTVLY